MAATEKTISQVTKLGSSDYKYGFSSNIEDVKAPKGLNTDVVKYISAQKKEPRAVATAAFVPLILCH